MIASDAAFARKIKQNVPVLDKIDKELLRPENASFPPGLNQDRGLKGFSVF